MVDDIPPEKWRRRLSDAKPLFLKTVILGRAYLTFPIYDQVRTDSNIFIGQCNDDMMNIPPQRDFVASLF